MVASLANFFSKEFEIIIICLVEKKIFYDINPNIKIRYARDAPPSKNPFSGIINNYNTIRNILKIIRENKSNILIGFTTRSNVISILSSLFSKIPCIVSERNNSKINPPNFFWSSLRNIFYKYSSCLVVQTNGNRKLFSKIMPDFKIKIIENAIAESLEHEIIFGKQTSDKINILTVGRLNPNKAHEIALTALSRLLDYEWTYTIVGDGPSRQELENYCKFLNIEERVTFTGSIKNVGDFYNEADLFIFTSRSEGFPNALMEAYYYGIPCISTNCDYGPSDIITDGIDGFLIPVDDYERLQNRIKFLLTDASVRLKISETAANNASRFKMENIAKQWNELIRSSLASDYKQ